MTHETYQPQPDYRLRHPVATQQVMHHLDSRRNTFTTNEQGDSPPFVEGMQEPPRKKKVLILEMNDILPSHQRDRMSDDGLEDNQDEEADEGSDKDKIDDDVIQDVIQDDDINM